MRTLIGKVENVEYFDTSRSGNSRYTASIGGVHCFTGVDSSLGSSISNYEGKTVKAQARIIRGKLTIDSHVEVMPDSSNALFYRGEFALIYSDMDHIPRMQISGKAGSTKWMNVTAAQLRAIEAVMLDPALAAEQGV